MSNKISIADWQQRILPYGFPSTYSIPLRLSYDAWKDPTDPLASLLEVFKWARIAGLHGIMPSVFVGQVFLESNMGLKQDALLGIKARSDDYKNGTVKRMRTHEVFSASEVERQKIAGNYIETVRTFKDGMQEIVCWQDFHYEDGLADDFTIMLDIYERVYWKKWGKPRPLNSWSPCDFLEKVTQAPPAYASDKNYVNLVLSIIRRYELTWLDFGYKPEDAQNA